MNNGLRIHHLLVVLTVGLIFGAVAVAQYSEEGVLNAISYKAFPANQPIAVRPLDNSDDNLEIQAEFERILRANGYVVNRDAPLVLSFDTEDRIGAWSDGGRRTVLELEGHGGVIGRDSARARFNIFDSQRGGIVNERLAIRISSRPAAIALMYPLMKHPAANAYGGGGLPPTCSRIPVRP